MKNSGFLHICDILLQLGLFQEDGKVEVGMVKRTDNLSLGAHEGRRNKGKVRQAGD
jgi:hypothetical protein